MSCNGGRLCFKVCSASKASLVHVRAMSFKMACTRGLGSPSASFSHSAARSLQSSEFNTGHPHKTVGAKQTRTGHRRVLRRERENSARRSATRLRSWLEFGQASVGYSTQGRVYLNVLLALRPTGLDSDGVVRWLLLRRPT